MGVNTQFTALDAQIDCLAENMAWLVPDYRVSIYTYEVFFVELDLYASFWRGIDLLYGCLPHIFP